MVADITDQNSKPPRRVLSVDAYEHVRRGLIRSRYRAGERLVLRPLAAELGLSPTPVREALLRLVSEHALELNDRNTAVVPAMTRRNFAEIHALRSDLEVRLAEAAALKASAHGIETLAMLHRQFVDALAIRDDGAVAALNADFHTTIAALADLPLTANILRNLWVRIGPLYALSRPMPSMRSMGDVHPHAALIDALRARDPQAAREAITRDFNNARIWIEPMLA
ncbi:GntR family transcriptional regulator [Gluconacetobacter entanii]|uniref:GntR family transcriptional regulator n=1 Tax=Gluconacetobacter entanii TaxID=108528 RepID=A0A318PWD2_9PROT|nr:GntR family transcriptional regulator [Gluconacetobacter entanii]MBE7620227.1 FCD domain-containing protein [Komagataeibacter sp. FXV2]MCE2579752.1 GntR family transcriptional regulator [Komagataeibacter sp. FNDCR1]MBY4638715.1 GntR family transcriptional regulator [Gluconacetobacter entanii]MCW4581317.1 GntR family transcriptional regulator [Gluconacetobacter entanii]MCW4584544.1 GntR family transcriptional regulator [Gluconacetobacter entanii]